MKRTTVAAAALLGVSAVSGAAALPGSAMEATGPASSAQATMPAAAAADETHTRRLLLGELASHQAGRFAFVGADRVRSMRTHRVVGYDTYTGRFYPRTNKVVIQVAITFRGGILVGRVAQKATGNRFEGRILKGTGKYSGVHGTINGYSPERGRTRVTLHYGF
jgi:hypothetical protein